MLAQLPFHGSSLCEFGDSIQSGDMVLIFLSFLNFIFMELEGWKIRTLSGVNCVIVYGIAVKLGFKKAFV